MPKRRRSYTTRARRGRRSDDGIAVPSVARDLPPFFLLTTPFRRLCFFAALTGALAAVIAAAVAA
jgi:hypothetical protein